MTRSKREIEADSERLSRRFEEFDPQAGDTPEWVAGYMAGYGDGEAHGQEQGVTPCQAECCSTDAT
jgi:hypothetical protein